MAETYYSLTDIVKLCDNLVAAMPTSFYSGIMTVRTGLANIPAADVVPVVRCGECKYCVEHYDTDGNAPYWVCKEWDSGTDYDGYCHYGEKKGR